MLDCLFYSCVRVSQLKIFVKIWPQTPFQAKIPWKCCFDLVRRMARLWAILSETGIFLWWFTVLASIKRENDNSKKIRLKGLRSNLEKTYAV